MTFKAGSSGNPAGRPKGALGKRARLAKLFESRSEELIEKLIELACGGNIDALRFCIDRLVPKMQRAPIDIELPEVLDSENISKVKRTVLGAVLEGKIGVGDAEKLLELINNQTPNSKTSSVSLSGIVDPLEAAKIYQQIIQGKAF